MSETVLVVDDEDGVRRTFVDWLDGLGCRVVGAADAESALLIANAEPVDLAVLDWNLGTGSDGLQLLEDLAVFQPDICAILVTGFAHQATPLRALRMGVRDYLDKSHDLTRESFRAAVSHQLDRLRPGKRQREVAAALAHFRAAVAELVPVARTSAALTAPVALPEAVVELEAFLRSVTGASESALCMHDAAGTRWFNNSGVEQTGEGIAFADTLAAAVIGLGRASVMAGDAGGATLLPWERGRASVLAVPAAVSPGVQMVLELFDKPGGFTDRDRALADAAATVGAALMRQALADQKVAGGLLAAVQAALDVTGDAAPTSSLPAPVRAGLQQALPADGTLELAEAVRALAARHGPDVLHHCLRLVQETGVLLDRVAGAASWN